MLPALKRAHEWVLHDPDPQDRAELQSLINRAEAHEPAAEAELVERFFGPLEFGTAGLRGVVGAGESRMNTAVVARATYGLVRHLLEVVPNAAARGLVVGADARPRSAAFREVVVEVATALGMRVHFFPREVPTPLVAHAVQATGAAGGVVVTASHNPPEYNGYKVYFANGAQIVPPIDAGIASQIANAPPADQVPRLRRLEATISGLALDASELEATYLSAIGRLVDPGPRALKIAYTALHGVGERFVREAFSRAGFDDLSSVESQAAPDGRFPTVRFPNPEEAPALERLLAKATADGSDIALANDPDADRLAVVARSADGRYVVLSGNEIGILLGHHVLTRRSPDPKALVITTIVSSTTLRRIAERLGAAYAETLTGFKWIANRGLELEREGAHFAFGYEEALGYTIGTVARDKDGVGAALVFAELAALEKARGRTVLDRLREIRKTFGTSVSLQKSVTLPGRDGAVLRANAMKALRERPPATLGGWAVLEVWDLLAQTRTSKSGVAKDHRLPENDTLLFELERGGRACVRPSGTEPKIKMYLELVDDAAVDGEASDEAKKQVERMWADLKAAAGV